MTFKDLAMTYCAYRIPLGAFILVFVALGLALDLTPTYMKNKYNSKFNDTLVSFLCFVTVCAVAAIALRKSPVLCGLTVGSDVWTLASTPLFM